MSDVTIFGMGYVGTVLAVGLARHGRCVTGIEVSAAKQSAFTAGHIPFLEPGLAEAFAACRSRIQIAPTMEQAGLAPIALICVGTPSERASGACDPKSVLTCLTHIGTFLRNRPREDHLILIRSTLWPGLWKHCRETLEQALGRPLGSDVRLGVQPEFLREGAALADFENPTLHVVGLENPQDLGIVHHLYDFISQPLVPVSPTMALLLKYVCNSFHSLKISFANEVATLASTLNVDPHLLMQLFCKDTRLNLSSKYLTPGLPFGGSCLPKDVRQMEVWSRRLALSLPLHENILASNQAHLKRISKAIAQYKKIAIVGLTFKAGVDDLRGSPLVDLIHEVGRKGTHVIGIDEALHPEKLVDANWLLFEDLRSLPYFTFGEDFSGDEQAVFFSFDTPQTRRLLSRVPKEAHAFSFFVPPQDLALKEFRLEVD